MHMIYIELYVTNTLIRGIRFTQKIFIFFKITFFHVKTLDSIVNVNHIDRTLHSEKFTFKAADCLMICREVL